MMDPMLVLTIKSQAKEWRHQMLRPAVMTVAPDSARMGGQRCLWACS